MGILRAAAALTLASDLERMGRAQSLDTTAGTLADLERELAAITPVLQDVVGRSAGSHAVAEPDSRAPGAPGASP